jgi:hypothetical protein
MATNRTDRLRPVVLVVPPKHAWHKDDADEQQQYVNPIDTVDEIPAP